MEHLPDRIVYTRHPQCLHNIDNDAALRQGIQNRLSPLTPRGEQQRDITAAYLRETFRSFDAVFTSTYTRTHTIPIAMGVGQSAIPESLLDERSMGIWHAMPRSVVEAKYPAEVGKLAATNYYDFKALDGESCPDVEVRQEKFLSDQKRFLGCESILISGHGIAGLCLRKVLLGSTVDDWHSWQRLRNASVTVYERVNGTFRCTLENFVPWKGILPERDEGREA